ncbi:MAG: cellulase family glycosylhydrolase [Actinomycetota bacterium]|nr:cellulase family glycosylhydrolase [Actinomycetota bacterium]
MPTRKGSQDRRTTRKQFAEEPVKAAAPKKAEPVVKPTVEAAQPTPPGKTPRRNALFPVGANYYPLDAETQSWGDWYARDPDEDFAAMHEARMALVRLYVSWKVIEPQVGQYNEDAVERLQVLIDSARTHKLQVIVCFFADDRLAELLDVPWGKKRDPRTDSYLIQREVALVQKVVNRFRSDAAVFAWDLTNEAFCSGFGSAAALEAWVSTMRDAVREVDPDRPIMISVDPEALYRHTGVDPRGAIDACEIAVSHVTSAYRAYAAEGPLSTGPSTYLDSFLLRSAARNLPVLLDDVGVLSLDQSHAEEASHVRGALYSGLMNRAAGVMLRRFRDLDTERREPYFRDPFEVLLGVVDADGTPKAAYGEVAAFSRVAARVDLRRYSLLQERTAIMIPSERYAPLPNLAGLYDARACLQAYIAAKEAHLPVTVARESDEFGAYSVLVVPSVANLEDSTWERLGAFVQGGGSLVLSYGGTEAHPAVRELFGIEFLGDGGGRDEISCRVAQPDVLGPLAAFDVALEVPGFALLGASGATVVATDAKGSPLLTMNQFGQGRAVYVALPVERAIAQGDPWATPGPVSAMLRTVYGAVARAAGCGAPAECDQPSVEVALFAGEADDIVLLLNHSPVKLTAGLSFDRTVSAISDVRGGAPVSVSGVSFGVPLDAGGAVGLRLTYA